MVPITKIIILGEVDLWQSNQKNMFTFHSRQSRGATQVMFVGLQAP